MSRTVNFKYDIGEEVRVLPLNMSGRVDALQINIDGPKYGIVYWNDGKRYCEWLYEWEIG